MFRSSFPALLLGAVLLAAPPANATTVLERSLSEMGTVSRLVVRGTVADQQASWVPDHSAIETVIHVQIRQILKGGTEAKPGDTITVLQPGGVVENRGQLVPGAAKFVDGEDVLLFLEVSPNTAGAWILERLSASKFRVETDAKGALRAVRDVTNLTFAARGPSGRIEPVDVEPRSSFTFDEIRAALPTPKRKAN